MRPGSVFGERFEVARQAGAGGNSTVYQARDRKTGRPIALKLLHASDAIDEERFAREAAVLAALRSPSVVRYIAHGSTGGLHWLATEWVEGEDLCDRLARRGLTVPESVELTRRVAEALAEAHEMGVVHRDIKPSNLLLEGGDIARVKIIDFGVVRRTRDVQRWTGTGILVGTPGYMAPEQARGASEIDPRADVYALGCVLFECLTGRPVFVGENAMAVLARMLHQTAPRLTALRPELPRALDGLVGRMLAREPADRPRDAGVVAKELAHVGPLEGGAPSRAAPASPSLGLAEQRVVTVVMVAIESQEPGASPSAEERLHAVTTAYGTSLEPLASGTFVALVDRRGGAVDRAVRAARAALAIRAALPDAPVAVASGRGVVLGGHLLGEVLDRGVRTLARAVDSAIPVDSTSASLLSRQFEIETVHGKRWLRGRTPGGATSTGRRPDLPYLGRDRELAMLLTAYRACAAENVARSVLIVGSQGSGKTRLAHELCARILREADERPPRVLTTGADPLRASIPLSTLVSALEPAPADATESPPERGSGLGPPFEEPDRQGAAPPDNPHPTRVPAQLAPLGEPRAAAALKAIGGAEPGAAVADVDVLPLGAALHAWLAEAVAERPLLLVVDDVHHADQSSLKLLDEALDRLRDRPFMAVALARPEVHVDVPKLWQSRAVSEVRLGPLSRKACQELARNALAPGTDPVELRDLADAAEGNPMLLEELCWGHRAGATRPPETALALVQARFDGLGAEARRALRAAGLLGERFWAGGVRSLLGEDAALAVDDWLAELCAGEVCLLTGRSDARAGLEYAFATPLLRDAAAATVIDEDRALGEELAQDWARRHANLVDPAAHSQR